MGTTAEKLTYLNTTKQKIKDGLNDLGAGITDSDTFRSYANALADIYDELPKVSGEGTDLELNNTKKGKLAITPKGNSSQFSTTGKNLYHILDWNTTTYPKIAISATTLSRINNNEIVLTATGTWANTIVDFGENFFNTNQDIIASADFLETISGRTSKVSLQLYGSSDGETYTSIKSSGSENITYNVKQHFSVTANTGEYTYIRLRIWNNATATSVSRGDSVINVSNILLALGTDDTYEPYTGGIPAPNPSYPYPVKTVTGENSLVICNENLFDKNDVTNRTYLDSNGNLIENYTWSISNYINVIPTFNYTYKGLTDVGTAPMSCYYDENKNFISSFKQATGINTISIPSNAKYIRFTVKQQASNDLNTFMFVKGSTAPSEYIEHQEQTYQLSLGSLELASSPDGTIRDEIIGTPNNWVKRAYIGKKIFDGTENFGMNYGTGMFHTLIENLGNLRSAYSNEYIYNSVQSKLFNNLSNYQFALQDYSSNIFIKNTDFSTASAFTTDLATKYQNNNPLVLCYPLSTPADVQITDTTLINQLNDIYETAHSCSGTTNITTTYEDGNEQMVIDASALKSWS